MKTYTVKFIINAIDAEDERGAAKTVAKWLEEGAGSMVYEVIDEETKEEVSIDLSEKIT